MVWQLCSSCSLLKVFTVRVCGGVFCQGGGGSGGLLGASTVLEILEIRDAGFSVEFKVQDYNSHKPEPDMVVDSNSYSQMTALWKMIFLTSTGTLKNHFHRRTFRSTPHNPSWTHIA